MATLPEVARYVLHEELGYDSEEVLVGHGVGNSGGQVATASTLVTDEDGNVIESLSLPWGALTGEFETLRPGETPNSGGFTEQGVDQQHDDDYRNGLAGMDVETYIGGNEEIDFGGEQDEREASDTRKRLDDDLIIGYMTDVEDSGSDVSYSEAAQSYVSSLIRSDIVTVRIFYSKTIAVDSKSS
jgi:hypothetical protein